MELLLDTFSYHLRMGRHGFAPSQNRGTLLWLFKRVVELELDGIQIDPMHIESYEPDALQNVRLFAESHGLTVELGMGGCDPVRIRERLAAAEAMGAKVIRTFVSDHRPDEDTLHDWRAYAISGLREAAQDAQKAGIRIALENHGDFLAEEVKEILDAVGSEWIGACVDTGNGLFLGEDPLHCVSLLAPYAASVHLKDAVSVPPLEENDVTDYRYVPYGEGLIPLDPILSILREASPKVNISIEMPCPVLESESETLAYEDRCVSDCARYARQKLGLRRRKGR